MAPTAGYLVQLKVGGTSTAMTGEACSEVDAGPPAIYRVTDAVKRVLDPDVAVTLYDNGVEVNAQDYAVDYLFGTFTIGVAVTGPVTVDANYIPLLTVAEARSITINMSAAELDASVMGEAFSKFELGQATAEGSIESLNPVDTDMDSGGGTTTFQDTLRGRSFLLLQAEIQSEYFRSWVKLPSAPQEASNDSLYSNTLNWKSSLKRALGRTEVVCFDWGSTS